MAWRKANGKDEGFATMRAKKPLVALAAEHPLEQTALEADYFRKPWQYKLPNLILSPC